jgi:branched-chain amino acid transport system ATP-binding protein
VSSLVAEHCTVAFGGLKAINDVSLAIPPLSITALIGPNGSGKSTFVSMAAGQISPRSGQILLDGEPITRMRPDRIVRRGLARTYQVPRVPRELTIEEIIDVPLFYAKSASPIPGGARNAAEIAAFCGLKPAPSTRCGQLSVSDLRRLEIARALACRPKVLLLDETMAGLSLEESDQVMQVVRNIHASGLTIVIVEHVMRIIAQLCDHAVVLNQGQLLAQGKPADVLTDQNVREAYLGKGFKL